MHAQPSPFAADDFDLEARFRALIARVDEKLPLTAVAVDPELAEPKSFLKLLKARHMLWRTERYRKVFGMRFTVKLPPLDQMNFIMYPEPGYDIPIFLFFCLLTGRKAICHVNVNCPFTDAAYTDKWVADANAGRHTYGRYSWSVLGSPPMRTNGLVSKTRRSSAGVRTSTATSRPSSAAMAAVIACSTARAVRVEMRDTTLPLWT